MTSGMKLWGGAAVAAAVGATVVVAARRRAITAPRLALLLLRVAIEAGSQWQERKLRKRLRALVVFPPGTE
jgi:hypothetical protein